MKRIKKKMLRPIIKKLENYMGEIGVGIFIGALIGLIALPQQKNPHFYAVVLITTVLFSGIANLILGAAGESLKSGIVAVIAGIIVTAITGIIITLIFLGFTEIRSIIPNNTLAITLSIIFLIIITEVFYIAFTPKKRNITYEYVATEKLLSLAEAVASVLLVFSIIGIIKEFTVKSILEGAAYLIIGTVTITAVIIIIWGYLRINMELKRDDTPEPKPKKKAITKKNPKRKKSYTRRTRR